MYMMHAKFHQILSASFDDASKGHTYFGAKIVNFLPTIPINENNKNSLHLLILIFCSIFL